MDQHPVPRQITTFEFKLIGFMTLKQFIYLIVFIPLGVVIFYIFPIPFLNFIFSSFIAFLGVALAFLPINNRPLDIWILNLYKRLTSPTQYFYKKSNSPIYFLTDVKINEDSYSYVNNFLQSQKYLNQYLQKTTSKDQDKKKQFINQLFNINFPSKENKQEQLSKDQTKISFTEDKKQVFLTGVVKNHKLIPLAGILIYIKNNQGGVIRLLKTNPHGVFATFKPLPEGEYFFEVKDPKNIYIFDTIKINIDNKNVNKPIEIFSKELL